MYTRVVIFIRFLISGEILSIIFIRVLCMMFVTEPGKNIYIIKTWNLRNWYCEDFFRRPKKKHWARENICVFRHPGIRITLNIGGHEKSFYTRDLLILKPPVQSSNDLKSWAKIWDWFIQQRNMCSYYLKYKIWKRLKKTTIICIKCTWKHQQPEIQSNVKPDYSRPKIVILSLLKRVRLLFVQVLLKFGAGGDWNKNNNPSLSLRVHNMVKGVTSIF